MARRPSMADPGGAGGAGGGTDPTDTGTDPTDTCLGGAEDGEGAGPPAGTVLVTICADGSGGYVVMAGDEDDGDDAGGAGGGAGLSADDDAAGAGAAAGGASGGAGAGAAGGAGGGGGADTGGDSGVPAATMGAALKATMDILQESESSAGAPGSSEEQFQSGFGGDSAARSGTSAGGRRAA